HAVDLPGGAGLGGAHRGPDGGQVGGGKALHHQLPEDPPPPNEPPPPEKPPPPNPPPPPEKPPPPQPPPRPPPMNRNGSHHMPAPRPRSARESTKATIRKIRAIGMCTPGWKVSVCAGWAGCCAA